MTEPERTPRMLEGERDELLRQVGDLLEMPMALLGFVWLVLVVLDLLTGLTPFLRAVVTVIWAIFILYFLLELILAPNKKTYLTHNWLTALSLAVPALRVVRIVRIIRIFRVARGARLLYVLGSLNRGMRALGATMGRRGFGYVVALTALVTLGGAAGMFAFEHHPGGRGLNSYGEALWWTAMLMTTMGSEYWPRTAEGRLLALILALYAFAVFGYVTATLASYFVGRDAESDASDLARERSVEALRGEVEALRADIRALVDERRQRG